MTLKERIENNAALLFGGALLSGFLAGISFFKFWIETGGRIVIETSEKKALETEIAKLKSDLSSAQQLAVNTKADAKRMGAEVASLQAENSRLLSAARLRNEGVRSTQPESKPPIGVPSFVRPPPPLSTWTKFKGFNNLTGLWRGESPDSVKFEIEILPQNGDEVAANFTAERLNCRLVTKLTKATDDQLTTSNYFFKPATATAGCPDVESIMLRPFETFSDFRMTYTSGKVWGVKTFKKI